MRQSEHVQRNYPIHIVYVAFLSSPGRQSELGFSEAISFNINCNKG